MEYKDKGSNSWSDDSDESERSTSSRETPRPVEPIVPAPNRPLLNGVIFNRQERERSATDVARAVAPGIAAPEQILPPLVVQPEHLRGPQPPKVEYLPDEDDDDEESDEQSSSASKPSGSTSFVEEKLAARRPEAGTISPPPSIVELAMPAEDVPAIPAAPVVPSFEQPQQPMAPSEAFAHPPVIAEVAPTPPERERPEAYQLTPAYAAEHVSPTPAAGGGEGTLPPPPERPIPSAQPPEPWERGHERPVHAQQQAYNTYHPQPVEYASQRSVENVRDEFRRKMAARSLMFLALGWYFGRRPVKELRKQVGNLQETSKQQQAELTNLSYQHQEAQSRITEQNRQIEQFTRPQAVPFQAEQVKSVRPPQSAEIRPQVEQQTKIIAENGEEIVLQPGQRLERAGAYSVVVDEHNQIVQNIIHYGDEYKRDRLHERPPTPFGAQDARYAQDTGAYSAGGGFANQPMASSGGSQSPPQYSLPMNDAGQTPAEEAQYLLPPPKSNPVTSALTSPWLWLGVGILLIAFFVAATI